MPTISNCNVNPVLGNSNIHQINFLSLNIIYRLTLYTGEHQEVKWPAAICQSLNHFAHLTPHHFPTLPNCNNATTHRSNRCNRKPRSSRLNPKLTLTGGSVANYLLQFPDQYTVRALTRDPSSPNALALEKRGAQVVRADLTKPQDLPSALDGCWGVFGVTNFYDSVRLPPPCTAVLALRLDFAVVDVVENRG